MLYTTRTKNTLVKFVDGKFKNCIGIIHATVPKFNASRTLYYSGIVFVPIIEVEFKTVYLRGTRAIPFESEPVSALQFYDELNEDALEFFAEKENDGKSGKIVKFSNNTVGFIVAIGAEEMYNGFTFKAEWVNRKHPTELNSGVAMKKFHCEAHELTITKYNALI